MKKKNNVISRLEEKTNQITATMKQLEQRWDSAYPLNKWPFSLRHVQIRSSYILSFYLFIYLTILWNYNVELIYLFILAKFDVFQIHFGKKKLKIFWLYCSWIRKVLKLVMFYCNIELKCLNNCNCRCSKQKWTEKEGKLYKHLYFYQDFGFPLGNE